MEIEAKFNFNLPEGLTEGDEKELQKQLAKTLQPVVKQAILTAPFNTDKKRVAYEKKYYGVKKRLRNAISTKRLSGGGVLGGLIFKKAPHVNLLGGSVLRKTKKGYSRGKMPYMLGFMDKAINNNKSRIKDDAETVIQKAFKEAYER